MGRHPGERHSGDAGGEQAVGDGEVQQEAVSDGPHLAVAEDGPCDAQVGDDGGGEHDRQCDHLRRRGAAPVAKLAVEGEEVARSPAAHRVVPQQVRRVPRGHDARSLTTVL